MLTRYVEPDAARFRREFVDGVEQIRIPVRRNWFVLLFLSFWIIMWSIGGGVAMYQAVSTHDLFLLVWLCFWAFGWLFAASMIASQIAGSEVIRVVGRDLETGIAVGKLVWRRRYRGDHIRNLSSSDPNPWGFPFRVQQPLPIGRWSRGAIKFDYGARTIYAASSAAEAEGRMIVEWLRPKLPRSASEIVTGLG